MLDLAFVRDNLPLLEEKLRQRGMDPAEILKDFREIDTLRRQAITQMETLKAERVALQQGRPQRPMPNRQRCSSSHDVRTHWID